MDCPACACTSATGAAAHAIQAALLEDDFDRALAMGLMEPDHACAAAPVAEVHAQAGQSMGSASGKVGLRRSRKALVPSRMSSVEKTRPNWAAS